MKMKILMICIGIACLQALPLQSADLASQLISSSFLCGASFFSPRSQSTNAARDLIGHRFMRRYNEPSLYNMWSCTVEYSRSFRPQRLAEYFFGTNTLTVTGSTNGNRSQNDMLADYFGLSQDFSSVTTLQPMAQNLITDLGMYAGYHAWYFNIHAPLVWAATEMKLLERVNISDTTTPYPAGYMDASALPAAHADWSTAMRSPSSYGDVQALKYGKIASEQLTKRGFSDVQAVVGYNMVNTEDSHAGFNVRLSLPTGSRPHSEYLFEPIVGNGKHWQVGVGFTGKVIIFEQDGDQRADLFVDINGTHIFKARQRRSFDFTRNGFASRYTLLKEFDASNIYTGVTIPAINITTLDCKVWNAIQLDLVFMFGYQYRGFNCDVGYNGWVKSSERITILSDPFLGKKYACKGIQDADANSTQSSATIIGNAFTDQALVADASTVFIQPNSLNPDSAASPCQFTHAFFLNLGYAWNTQSTDCTAPFIGVGAKVEFEGVYPHDIRPNKNAMSQWSLWAKGGLGW